MDGTLKGRKPMRSLLMFFSLWLFPAALLAADEPSNSPGLLFYLSGGHGFRAAGDYSDEQPCAA